MDERPNQPTNQLPGLPAGAFRKADPSPDAAFYVQPRFVTHIDEGAIAAVTAAYCALFPADGNILDHMRVEMTREPASANNVVEFRISPLS